MIVGRLKIRSRCAEFAGVEADRELKSSCGLVQGGLCCVFVSVVYVFLVGVVSAGTGAEEPSLPSYVFVGIYTNKRGSRIKDHTIDFSEKARNQ